MVSFYSIGNVSDIERGEHARHLPFYREILEEI